jgi:hypothetical protein
MPFRRSLVGWRLWLAIVVALVALAPRRAHAMDAEVTGDAAGQFYDVRSPTGETVLPRRRLLLTIGVSGYDLLDAPHGDPKAADLRFRARLRYDADYGASGAVADPTNPNNRDSFVPGFSQGPFDLMYAYVEGRRFFKGVLGFKLGRQYVTDALGWWSFDGGEVSVATPYFVKAEGYVGLEERGGLFLSTPRFERDGIWRGNRSQFDSTVRDLYPSFQPATLAPAFGAALESTGVTWIHGRVTYRRVYNTGGSNVTEYTSGLYAPAAYDGWRTSSDRLGYAMDANWSDVGGAKAGIVYDVYRGEVTQGYASIDGYLGTRVTLSADYDYYVPSFDADSIWNFFAGEPMNDVGLRGNFDATSNLSVSGGTHLRIFNVQTGPFDPGNGQQYQPSPNYLPNAPSASSATYYPTNGHPFDGGGNVAARWRTQETTLGLRGSGNFGSEGDRVGGDLSAEHVFETRYLVNGRAGVWQWDDKIRADRNTTSVNYVAGVGYRFAPRAQAMVEWEHDINRLVGQRFRLMLWLTLAVTK